MHSLMEPNGSSVRRKSLHSEYLLVGRDKRMFLNMCNDLVDVIVDSKHCTILLVLCELEEKRVDRFGFVPIFRIEENHGRDMFTRTIMVLACILEDLLDGSCRSRGIHNPGIADRQDSIFPDAIGKILCNE